ncbi:MAG: hypothetical protein HQM10_00260 [Candidatus Riflebacteria bacterium]|nr:hypothetical protein [Candidatus Riflebacteria bacterium]
MDDINIILKAFSRAIFCKVLAIRNTFQDNRFRVRIMESITMDIRKYSDLIPVSVSVAANNKAKEMGIDLKQKRWQDQNKFDKGRKTFQLEHFRTVKEIRQKCIEANNEEEVEILLRVEPKVVWILKDEDERLSRLGYRSNRPNPQLAYEAAGIVIIDVGL